MRAFAVVALLTVACGGVLPSGGDNVAADATFLLANHRGLLLLGDTCKPIGGLAELPQPSVARTPALSPDRRRVIFALAQPPTGPTGLGSDIFEVSLARTGLRRVVEHGSANVFYLSPLYDPKGNAIYVHRRTAIMRDGLYAGDTDEILRIDLATNERRTIVTGGADPAISPDGERLVFVMIREGRSHLWTADLPDGVNARPLLPSGESFSHLQAPRFSPDGKFIVFAAAGREGGSAHAQGGGRLAHGIPSEVFMAKADGSDLTSVGSAVDDVVPAWSWDGSKIAYVGLVEFVVVTLADRSVRMCSQGDPLLAGDLLWLR